MNRDVVGERLYEPPRVSVLSRGGRGIDRLKERQAMRRRIRFAVVLRRLDTRDLEPEPPVAQAAE